MSHRKSVSLAVTNSGRRCQILISILLPSLLLTGNAWAEISRSQGVLAAKTRWANPYYVIDSGIPGPTLLVAAGLHGNEPAGFRAAEQIRHWPLERGKLIVVPRVNSPGLLLGSRWLPGESEATRNANRNFPKTDGPDEAKAVPVRALWDFVQKQKPDWVVDLHEGYDFHIANPKSDGSSIIYFDTPEMQAIAGKIHDDVNATIDDPQRQIVKLSKSGPINGGLVRAAVERLGAQGFCLETTYGKQPVSTRTRQHRVMVHCLMRQLEMAAGDAHVMTSAHETSGIRVALYDAGGTGGAGPVNLRRILKSRTGFTLCHVGPPDIRAGVLDQFQVVIFPGGSGSKQAIALGLEGRQTVRSFVESGGGYIGICGGAYLATAKYDWGLALLDAKTFTGKRMIPGVGEKSMWFRGSGTVKMELTGDGRRHLGDVPDVVELRYANGPILSSASRDDLPAYVTWAVFRSEVAKYEPQQGTMVDTPAIVVAEFGKGRVVVISPHPEMTVGLESLVKRCVTWAAANREGKAPAELKLPH